MKRHSEQRFRRVAGGLGLICFLLLVTLEILTEEDELSLLDLTFDALTILLTIGAAAGVALLTILMQRQHEEKMDLLRDLDIARSEGRRWRGKVQTHLSGLKDGMNIQFGEWGLTTAECEVGLLILKGLSHKEIATLRTTTEATVRQQAQSIYRKSKLPGKTAFSAYFLEDLFTGDEFEDDSALGNQTVLRDDEPMKVRSEVTSRVTTRSPGESIGSQAPSK